MEVVVETLKFWVAPPQQEKCPHEVKYDCYEVMSNKKLRTTEGEVSSSITGLLLK
jgi:hypothetical protein